MKSGYQFKEKGKREHGIWGTQELIQDGSSRD